MQRPITENVVNRIVKNDLCCQCGICAAMCAKQSLTMRWYPNGDLNPTLTGECNGCNICLAVCPFEDEDLINENSIQRFREQEFSYDEDIGFYLKTLVGYSCQGNHRKNGSSGGMVTWLLEELINNGAVDAVLCVAADNRGDQLFSYKICFNGQEIREASGSKYYPVSLTDALQYIKNNDLRYAVVGLPCRIRGLYRAMDIFPELKRRIIFTIGLTCGHLPNKYYTEYLVNKSGMATNSIQKAYYRRKDKEQPASNYGFFGIDNKGQQGSTVYFSQISKIWHRGFFQVNACNFCNDVFAELADVTMMDAWLPQYIDDYRGHSLIVVRNDTILDILENGSETNKCKIEPISIGAIKKSQQGVIFNKKVLIKGKVYWALRKGKAVPKRKIDSSFNIYKKHKLLIENSFKIQQESKELWPKYRDGNIQLFDNHFAKYNKWFFIYILKYYLLRIIRRLD